MLEIYSIVSLAPSWDLMMSSGRLRLLARVNARTDFRRVQPGLNLIQVERGGVGEIKKKKDKQYMSQKALYISCKV